MLATLQLSQEPLLYKNVAPLRKYLKKLRAHYGFALTGSSILSFESTTCSYIAVNKKVPYMFIQYERFHSGDLIPERDFYAPTITLVPTMGASQ